MKNIEYADKLKNDNNEGKGTLYYENGNKRYEGKDIVKMEKLKIKE